MSVADLGKPFDADFRPLHGSESSSLFPRASEVPTVDHAVYEHELIQIESQEQFRVELAGFLVGGAKLGAEQSDRHLLYRAIHVEKVQKLDDSGPMRKTPEGAVYYLAQIELGHSYEAVLYSNRWDLNVGISATLAHGESLRIGLFAKKNHLEYRDRMVGLKPTHSQAIFATSPEAIQSSYEIDAAHPSPVRVVYRVIPGIEVDTKRLRWEQPPRKHEIELSDNRAKTFIAPRGGYFYVRVEADEGIEVTWERQTDSPNWPCENQTKEKRTYVGRCRLDAGGTLTIKNPGYGLGNDADGFARIFGDGMEPL